MNIRRGAFRFWVLFTAAWLIGSAIWAYNVMQSTWLPAHVYFIPDATGELYQLENPFRTHELESKLHTKFVYDHNVTLYVHTSVSKEVSEAKRSSFEKTYVTTRPAELRENHRRELRDVALVAVIPPVVVFVIGYALGWAFAGFRRTT